MRSLPTGKEGKTSDYCDAATPNPNTAPTPTVTTTPAPTARPAPTTSPTPSYTRPTGYDIFAPGGLKGDCENNPAPRFTSHITDLSKIYGLTPAGTVQGGDLKPHGYLGNKPSELEVPVYAPVDSYLITYAYYGQGGRDLHVQFPGVLRGRLLFQSPENCRGQDWEPDARYTSQR